MSEAEQPRPDEEPPDAIDETSEAAPTSPEPEKRPWPDVDPSALQNKRFMIADDFADGQLAVRASEGDVLKEGTPARLFSKLADQIGDSIKVVGNLPRPPLVMGAFAGASMTLVFGDETVEDTQTRIPYHATLAAGETISRLIASEGADLDDAAARLGLGVNGYVALTELVQTEGIKIEWEPRGRDTTVLDAARASRHHRQLTKPPVMREHPITIEGFLYRVIYDGPTKGRAGIRLTDASPKPLRRRGRLVIVRYDSEAAENLILHKLIGEPVIARVMVKEPVGGVTLPLRLLPHPIVTEIERGQFFEEMVLGQGESDDDNEALWGA